VNWDPVLSLKLKAKVLSVYSLQLASIRVKKNYKPVSRILCPPACAGDCYHLSCPCITTWIYLPTLQPGPGTGPTDEQPVEVGLHGISACKVYPPQQLLAAAVSSYLTFSPLPRTENSRGSYFLWHYLFLRLSEAPAVSRCIALRCPDFPSHYKMER
jgi:hypothetical protein